MFCNNNLFYFFRTRNRTFTLEQCVATHFTFTGQKEVNFGKNFFGRMLLYSQILFHFSTSQISAIWLNDSGIYATNSMWVELSGWGCTNLRAKLLKCKNIQKIETTPENPQSVSAWGKTWWLSKFFMLITCPVCSKS